MAGSSGKVVTAAMGRLTASACARGAGCVQRCVAAGRVPPLPVLTKSVPARNVVVDGGGMAWGPGTSRMAQQGRVGGGVGWGCRAKSRSAVVAAMVFSHLPAAKIRHTSITRDVILKYNSFLPNATIVWSQR